MDDIRWIMDDRRRTGVWHKLPTGELQRGYHGIHRGTELSQKNIGKNVDKFSENLSFIALIWNKQFFKHVKNLKYTIFNKGQHLYIVCTLIFYDFFQFRLNMSLASFDNQQQQHMYGHHMRTTTCTAVF